MFRLEKYNGRNRYQCPDCGAVREFVRYVNEYGEYISLEVGKCNREVKCGYHYTPRQFFADNPKCQAKVSKTKGNCLRKRVQVADVSKRIDFIQMEIVQRTLAVYKQNSFVTFLLALFNNEDVQRSIQRYLIGTWIDMRTVFWQIDTLRRVRTGKLMAYNASTGKRCKDRNPSWVHAKLKRTGELGISFGLEQCYFGEHLLTLEPEKPVAMVESEKTAVIASLFMPQFLWLATGGSTNLRIEQLARTMRGRRVALFPDSSKFITWLAKSEQARRSFGLDIKVSDLLELKLTAEEKLEDFDIADFLIADLQRKKMQGTLIAQTELVENSLK